MPALLLPPLQSGGLIVTYSCTSACRHCLYRCSPRAPRDYISPGVAEEMLGRIRSLGCDAVHVGGGEPFLRPEALGDVLDAAQRAGVSVEYVETNSSWFHDRCQAEEVLASLARCGLRMLLVSISPFHNEYIPFGKVKGVIAACGATGIRVFPWTGEMARDLAAFDDATTHGMEEFAAKFGEDYLAGLPGRYWISPGGRALETFAACQEGVPLEELLARNRGGCRELADTSHFHVDLNGNYIPGLCAGLAVDVRDVGGALDPQRYPCITTLFTKGIAGLVDLVRREYGFVPRQSGYWTKCQICFEVRRFLAVEKKVSSRELQPSWHYAEARDFQATGDYSDPVTRPAS